ncbi:MAG TPA: hypothetical protein VF779_06565 [Pyrinomonadaceae bacterium]
MNPPIKRATVLAKIVLLLSAVCLISIFLINGTLGTGVAQSEEREFVDTTPKHLPIKVKIKKEKEQAFKDLKNEKWVRDLEIEVTNTGDKPIYLLHFTLVLPEVKDETGNNVGFVLHYGRAELGDIKTKAEPDDVPIKPGETYVFTITDGQVLGWESFVKKQNKLQPKKVILKFGTLSFGDGTGFWATSGIPFSRVSKPKSSLSRNEQTLNKNDAKELRLRSCTPCLNWE